MHQALIVSLDNEQKDLADKLKEDMSIDQTLETFNLRDVDTKKRYKQHSNFNIKLENCLKDSNRVFLVLSPALKNAIENDAYSDNSRLSNTDTQNVFKRFVAYEKDLPIAESKLVLLDFGCGTEAPVTLSHLEKVENIFKDRDVSKISQEAVDIILGKSRIRNHGFPTNKGKGGCSIS